MPWEAASIRKTSGVAAAVDAEDLSSDVARVVGDEERASGCDVFGPADAPYRGRCDDVVKRVLPEVSAPLGVAQHRGVDEARRYGVDGDALGAVFECEGFRQTVDGGLGRNVVRFHRCARVRAGGRDVDDAPPTRREHVW